MEYFTLLIEGGISKMNTVSNHKNTRVLLIQCYVMIKAINSLSAALFSKALAQSASNLDHC